MTTKKKAVGLKVLTKRDLERLANKIYNPKTGKYLRLCVGALKNGPDKITGRTMHCGLGELELFMTGKEPPEHISENIVVQRAMRLAKPDRDDLFFGELGEIHIVNDAAKGYRSRARAVAKKLRAAAALLVGK
jgi:hypothetical protein